MEKTEMITEIKPMMVIHFIGKDEEEKMVSEASFSFFLKVHLDFDFTVGRLKGIKTGSNPKRNTSTIVEVFIG